MYYYEKTGKDLLNIPLKNESSYLYTVIKKAFYRWWYYERRTIEKTPAEWLREPSPAPDEIVNGITLMEMLPHETLVRLLSEGNLKADAASSLGMSRQAVQYQANKIKSKLTKILNPIAGSRVKLLNKLSKKQFDALEDKNEYKNTHEGNETVAIYVKDIEAYDRTGEAEGVLVKLTKD
jgi:predicted DNA-binding protein (UPF0251 family)